MSWLEADGKTSTTGDGRDHAIVTAEQRQQRQRSVRDATDFNGDYRPAGVLHLANHFPGSKRWRVGTSLSGSGTGTPGRTLEFTLASRVARATM